MASPTLLHVTQVSPYRDGPAGVHGVLDQSAVALAQLAGSAGLDGRRVTDVRHLGPDELAAARVVALFTIGETPWSPDQRDVLLEGVRSGRTALVAIHSATDSCHGWDAYGRLVGARFDGHPWTRTCTLDVVDPTHPAVAHLGETWRWHDEVYTFRELRPDARVLLSARPSELEPDAGTDDGPVDGYPLSWCFSEGSGRVFSTSLGHFPHAWESPDYLRHLAGGLDWALARDGT
jgi:type 1 glutamine amidotransferase